MTDRTPQQICESLLGLTIQSIEIDPDEELITFTLDSGQFLEFTGDDLEMYVSDAMTDS
jgi:hypothetical protein